MHNHMEKLPSKLPQRVRKSRFDFIKDWQDDIKFVEDAEFLYKLFQMALKECGLDLTKNVKVLEIGSGNNIFLNYAQKQGVDIVGVEASPRGGGSSLVIARAEQLPFKDGTFDVVLSSAVFDTRSYDQYQDIMLAEISRVLKHKGVYLGNEYEFSSVRKPPIKGLELIPSELEGVVSYKKS